MEKKMNKQVDAGKIKNALKRLYSCIPELLPAAGWYLADKQPSAALLPEKGKWTCMFASFDRLVEGDAICFSVGRTGCSGASCYLGFTSPAKNAGYFLAEKEKFKKNIALGNAFYDAIPVPAAKPVFVVWKAITRMAANTTVAVVNLWIHADNLADLVTLANYDRPTNDNVVIPFASGCQSIWSIPYGERVFSEPKCVVGCIDPAMKKYLPSAILSFAMPAHRFVEMTENIAGSFLGKNETGT